MVNLEPYNFQKKTNIDEHNDLAGKINEIIGVTNDNVDSITDLEQNDAIQDTNIASNTQRIGAAETEIGTLNAKMTNVESEIKDCAVASSLSTTDHIGTDKLGISIDSVDGRTNKVAYIPVATEDTIGLMSAMDKAKLDGLDGSIPIASSTVLGGIKVGANLSITPDGVLSSTGDGGSGVALPAHTIGANDDNPLVQVVPVIQSGNIILRTTYKDYASDGSTSQKQDDSPIFPSATAENIGLMSSTDKTKLDGMPTGGDIALKSELSALTGELMNTPADVVGMATGTAGGLMSATDKTKMDAIPTPSTIATDSDIADLQNQITEFAPVVSTDLESTPPTVTVQINGKSSTANLPSGGGKQLVTSGDITQFVTFDRTSKILKILKEFDIEYTLSHKSSPNYFFYTNRVTLYPATINMTNGNTIYNIAYSRFSDNWGMGIEVDTTKDSVYVRDQLGNNREIRYTDEITVNTDDIFYRLFA